MPGPRHRQEPNNAGLRRAPSESSQPDPGWSRSLKERSKRQPLPERLRSNSRSIWLGNVIRQVCRLEHHIADAGSGKPVRLKDFLLRRLLLGLAAASSQNMPKGALR